VKSFSVTDRLKGIGIPVFENPFCHNLPIRGAVDRVFENTVVQGRCENGHRMARRGESGAGKLGPTVKGLPLLNSTSVQGRQSMAGAAIVLPALLLSSRANDVIGRGYGIPECIPVEPQL